MIEESYWHIRSAMSWLTQFMFTNNKIILSSFSNLRYVIEMSEIFFSSLNVPPPYPIYPINHFFYNNINILV
jgi:hypothetical protein